MLRCSEAIPVRALRIVRVDIYHTATKKILSFVIKQFRMFACHFAILQAYAGTHVALADQDIESEEGWRSTSKFNHQTSPK